MYTDNLIWPNRSFEVMGVNTCVQFELQLTIGYLEYANNLQAVKIFLSHIKLGAWTLQDGLKAGKTTVFYRLIWLKVWVL